jgi:hypothetical protein
VLSPFCGIAGFVIGSLIFPTDHGPDGRNNINGMANLAGGIGLLFPFLLLLGYFHLLLLVKNASGSIDPYDLAMTEAVKFGKPLIVFVRCENRDVSGCVTVRVDSFPGVADSAIVLAVPSPTGYKKFQLLGTNTSTSDIIAEVALRQAESNHATS